MSATTKQPKEVIPSKESNPRHVEVRDLPEHPIIGVTNGSERGFVMEGSVPTLFTVIYMSNDRCGVWADMEDVSLDRLVERVTRVGILKLYAFDTMLELAKWLTLSECKVAAQQKFDERGGDNE